MASDYSSWSYLYIWYFSLLLFDLQGWSVKASEKDFLKLLCLMCFIFQLVYGVINNSFLSICVLKTILSVVFMNDELRYWENKIPSF